MHPITNSKIAHKYINVGFPKRLAKQQECFVAMAMDAANIPIGNPWVVAVGTADSVCVHPRDIFRNAVRRNAVSIIVAHNHPSGGLKPSAEDILLTERIIAAGKFLGIPLLDHIIVFNDTYKSIMPVQKNTVVSEDMSL